MPNVNLSRMTVDALMDLRKRVDEMLHRHRAEIEKQLERMDALVGGRRIVRGRASVLKGKESPAEISWSIRRNLGRSWRRAKVARCCHQRWKETRPIFD